MNKRRSRILIAALLPLTLLLTLPGCKDCGKKGPQKPGAADGGTAGAKVGGPAALPTPPPSAWRALLAMLPASPLGFAFAGDGASLLRSAREALTKLRGTSVGMILEELVRMAQHKMGVPTIDAFNPSDWIAHGFDPAAGAALVQLDGERGFLFLGAREPQKVEPLLQGFLKKTEEIATFKKVGAVTVGLRADQKVGASYQFHQGYVIVAEGFTTEAEIGPFFELATKDGAKRLQGSPEWNALLKGWDFSTGAHLVFMPALVSVLPDDTKPFFDGFKGLVARLGVSGAGATVDAFMPTSPQTADSIRALAVSGPAQPGLPRALGEDTLIAIGARVNQWALLQKLIALSPAIKSLVDAALKRLKEKMDIDVEKELFQNLTGDSALGIHKLDATVFPMLLGGVPFRKIFASDPFHVTILLRVKDPVVAGKFLKKISVLADTPVEKVGAIEAYPLSLAKFLGEEASKGGVALRFALSGDTLALTIGKGRMEKALAALAANPFAQKVTDPAAKQLLIDAPGAPTAYIVGSTILENAKDLEGALLKKGSLLLSNIVQKITEVLEKIADVSFGGEAQPAGVRGWLRLRLK